MNFNRLLGILCATLTLSIFPASIFAKDNGWQLHASDINSEYVGAPVANGRIGILPWKEPFSIRHVVLNHVFDADAHNGISQVLYGINPFNIKCNLTEKPLIATIFLTGIR